MKMIKYTDINQFRQVVKHLRYVDPENPCYDFPTLPFEGTVKLHGTNAGISYFPETDELSYQARTHPITIGKDNAGFAFFADSHKEYFRETLSSLSKDGYIVTVFGEWCGGNIQKGVAINGLEKMFVIFGMKYTNTEDELDHWYEKCYIENPSINVYNILKFPTFHLDIDFNHPEIAQDRMITLVTEVENECPVGKYFGKSGVGEGIVWCNYDSKGHRQHIFKTKGEKHSSSRVKKIAEVDIEKVNSINEFVDYAVTENRLNQAIEQVFTVNNLEPDIKMMGPFIKWISTDVIKEELDTMVKNKLEPKDIGRELSNKCRRWFMEYLNKRVGL